MDKKKVAVLWIITHAYALFSQRALFPLGQGGLNLGISVSAGSHLLRGGIWIHGFYVKENLEIKTECRTYFNLKSWGPPGSFFEIQYSLGAMAGLGPADSSFYSSLFFIHSPHTGRKMHLGYAMNFYYDTRKTSQRTGTIWINYEKFTFFSENDILARRILDRYRTGAFGFSWRYKNTEWTVSSVLWTGQWGSGRDISHPHFRLGCYLDTTGGRFTSFSHGVWQLKGTYVMPMAQQISIGSGWDSEKVRDFIQNKIIHDMIFLPKSWLKKSRNCHIPMLDNDQNPYLFREGQKIKKSKWFVNTGINESIFY